MSALLALLALAGPVAEDPKPPVRLTLELTIDARSGVSFGTIAGMDIGLDGSVVVVDQGHGVIYRFFPTGKVRDSLGHRGQGPGEFVDATGIALGPAGELVLADSKNRRITFWSRDGRLLATTPLTGGLPVDLLWRGADPVLGTLVASDSIVAAFAPVRFGTGTSAGPWIGWFAEATHQRPATAVSCSACPHTLSSEGKLLVASPDTVYRVSEVDAMGKVTRRWGRPDAPALENRTRFQGIGMDRLGRLFALVSNAGFTTPVVDVFDNGGKFLGTVVPGELLQALVIRGSRIVALGESAEGVPVIHVYQIEEVP